MRCRLPSEALPNNRVRFQMQLIKVHASPARVGQALAIANDLASLAARPKGKQARQTWRDPEWEGPVEVLKWGMSRVEATWHPQWVAFKYGKLFILPHKGAGKTRI